MLFNLNLEFLGVKRLINVVLRVFTLLLIVLLSVGIWRFVLLIVSSVFVPLFPAGSKNIKRH